MNMYRKTEFKALITALLLSTLLAACMPVVPTQVEPVTLNFFISMSDQDYYKSLIEKFKAQSPEITIELVGLESGGGGVWDVRTVTWEMLADPTNPTLTSNALDLSPYLTQETWFNRNDYFPGVLDAFNIEGQQVALPYGLDPWVMYYNKDLFDQNLVDYPKAGWSLTDFVSTAAKLTDAEQGIYGYSPIDYQIDSFFFLYEFGGRIADESGKPTFTEPKTVEAMQWYARLFNEYAIAPSPKKVTSMYGSNGYGKAIVSGKTGMWVGPFSMRIDTNLGKLKLGMAPLPADGTPLTAALFEGYAISKLTKHPDACWKWIAFLAQEMPFYDYPARLSLADSIAFENAVGVDAAQGVRDAMKNAVLADRSMVGPIGNKMNILVRVAEQIANGDVTVEQALTAAQTLAENTP